jgi:hypothetical protein
MVCRGCAEHPVDQTPKTNIFLASTLYTVSYLGGKCAHFSFFPDSMKTTAIHASTLYISLRD